MLASENRKSEVFYITKENTTLYVILVLFIYVLEILGGIYIYDISIIFNFVGAIASSSITFIFPGVFIVVLEKK
jgi:hypothetical protein